MAIAPVKATPQGHVVVDPQHVLAQADIDLGRARLRRGHRSAIGTNCHDYFQAPTEKELHWKYCTTDPANQ
jgi:hypothetical protein